ncbi:GntR family transcriptional regulator [Tunicatimonas pelagia]|uniref:GntR family transcriptional regulator n=1 Tax=Tunicatimonas pelagia TaxID=931531 RepID=UPI0026663EB7|nr:GntR family transcriptional regulator [Tunicatimonas pelagia]WKN44542.1 GntR family transcriptional regulator [Tunicatimonas pelagia]
MTSSGDESIIFGDSRIPKYQQVINLIKSDIELGIFKQGERIPSINETSEDFYLSRDTVEKAYNKLREEGVLVSVPGKGYYVNTTQPTGPLRVLIAINKISAHKKKIVSAFVETLGDDAVVETFVHHYSTNKLERIISENLGKFNYYAIIPCFKDFSDKTQKIIEKIPSDKLVLIDKDIDGLPNKYKAVCENFEEDTYRVLTSALDAINKYKKLYFVFPDGNQYRHELITSFKRFCTEHHFEYCITNVFDPTLVRPQDLYLVIEDDDLVDIIKYCKNHSLKVGQDVGIVSFNDTPLKEVLHDGIAVISTDFEKMGETAARLILEKRSEKVHNPFYLIRRPSL